MRVRFNNLTNTVQPQDVAQARSLPGKIAAMELGSQWSGDARCLMVADRASIHPFKFEATPRGV